MQDTDMDALAERMQQVLERDYVHLEWRVLVPAEGGVPSSPASGIVVHARTRDFRYGCRVERPRTMVLQAPTLRFLVAEVVAEVEHRLAELAAAS